MNKQSCCPTCSRPFPKAKAPKGPEDLSEMNETQLRAHYKKIAPVEDVRFLLRVVQNTPLDAPVAALLSDLERIGGKHTTETKARYNALQRAFRGLTGYPATGVPAPFKGLILYRDKNNQFWKRGKRGVLTAVNSSYSWQSPVMIRPVRSWQKFKGAIKRAA